MGDRRDLDFECGHHRSALFSVVLITFLTVTGRAPRWSAVGSVCLVSAALLRDCRRVFARGERAVHGVSRPEPGLGGRDARRLLHRADHLSDRRAPGAAALLSVSVAARRRSFCSREASWSTASPVRVRAWLLTLEAAVVLGIGALIYRARAPRVAGVSVMSAVIEVRGVSKIFHHSICSPRDGP